MIKVQVDVDSNEMFVFAQVNGTFDVFDFVREVANTVDLFCDFTMSNYDDVGTVFTVSFDHKDKYEDTVHYCVNFTLADLARIKFGEIVKLEIW